MPRISLWNEEKLGQDFVWFDKQISEMFTVGGVTTYVHKYLGAENPNVTNDATQPNYPNLSALNIQDLLFQENRDRKYAKDIYRMRCHYNVQDLDLDLSQFGLMIASGTLYIVFPMNDMVQILGRKLMSGDVLELPNLKEFFSLDTTLPVALKRFYVVQEGTRPAQGFSPTWWPHLWRVKCTPLIDSQEYQDILNQIVIGVNGQPVTVNGNTVTYGNIGSSVQLYDSMTDAIVAQAQYEVPDSGYNTDALWSPLFINGDPRQGPLPSTIPTMPVIAGIPSGNANGVTTAFTLPSTPYANTLIVWDNISLIPNVGYTLSGNVVTFTVPPASGDDIAFQYLGANATPVLPQSSGIPAGTANGVNTIFTLPVLPYANTLIVWNNVAMTPKIDYTTLGNQITFTVPPAPGDNLFYQCQVAVGNPPIATYGLVPVGNVDGNNTTFVMPTLTYPNSLLVWENGLLPPNSDAYTVNGAQIVFTTAPAVNSNIYCQYLQTVLSPQQKWTGYLVNNGNAMNGFPVTPATEFPVAPTVGQYVLRQDYFPARLYRWSGSIWEYVSTEQRTSLTLGTGQTLRDKYVNNANTFVNSSGNIEPILQNLSNLLRVDKGGNPNS